MNSQDRRPNAARWALHMHYARMLTDDGRLLEKRASAAGMTENLVKDIADEYRVTRSIPSVCEQWGKQSGLSDWPNHHRSLVAEAINGVTWKTGLADRAGQCKQLVESLAEEMKPSAKKDRSKPISFASGMTKLSWFDAPGAYWTIFDKYARRSVCGNLAGDASGNMVAFYKTLEDRKFNDVSDSIGGAISELGPRLYPGKIIDHYLMASAPVDAQTPADFGSGNALAGIVLDRHLCPCTRELLDQSAKRVAEILLDSKLVPAA